MDDTALQRLRDLLAQLHDPWGSGSELMDAATSLAEISAMLPPGMGLTIDFRAAATLGQPLVVLRPSGGALDPCFADLTPREREVAGLLATGLRNKDIALALGITLGTVKDHVHRILDKSGLDSRAAVAAMWRPSAT